jgi:uncharacterized protein YodC (DUF2158 family)
MQDFEKLNVSPSQQPGKITGVRGGGDGQPQRMPIQGGSGTLPAPPKEPACLRYAGLLVELGILDAAGRGDGAEAQFVTDQMDRPWREMSPFERDCGAELAALLNRMIDGKEQPVGDELKVGDVVRLKSGGPGMTVMAVSESKVLECHWFDLGHCHQYGYFPPGALVKIGAPA